MATNPLLTPMALPYTGIASVDAGFTIIQQQMGAAQSDLSSVMADTDAAGGTDAPTNAPTPTGISVLINSDGSMDVTLTWNYAQGAVGADFIIIFWNQGGAPLAAPTTTDKALLLNSTATAFTFNGYNPASNYRFGIAAGRTSTDVAAVVAGAIISPTVTPDWADVSASGNYTATLGGSPTSTVVANASNGQTAYSGTTNYRSAGAPSVTPVPAAITTGLDTDGSARYTLTWNITNGALKVEGFLVFVKEGDTSSFDVSDPHFELGAQNGFSYPTSITLKGYPSDRTLSFAVAAFRRTENATEIGTIISSAASPDWQGVNSQTPSYAGTIFGIAQHNFSLNAIGRSATDTMAGIYRDGAPILWAYRDDQFQGGSRGVYGLSYNLTIWNLTNQTVDYQHCYDVFDYGTPAGAEDLFLQVQTGGGNTGSGFAGKFGFGFRVNASSGQTAWLRTQGAHSDFTKMKWAECWIRRSGNPAARCPIMGAFQNSDGTGYSVPFMTIAPDGTLTGHCWNGSALLAQATSINICDGNWHHVATSVTSSGMHTYVDGVRFAVPVAGLTSLTMGAPATLYFAIGYGVYGQLLGVTDIDEVILTDNTGIRTSEANFTPPTAELSDYAFNITLLYTWHFQEVWFNTGEYPVNSRAAARALSTLIQSMCDYTLQTGTKFCFAIAACHEPWSNRLNDGLPDALVRIGGSRSLFAADTFQTFSAYALVGPSNAGEGNGYEAYNGVVGDDPNAHVQVNWQTQNDKMLGTGGSGWQLSLTPGVPTNSPTPAGASIFVKANGTEEIIVTWNYTQPALSGTNKLADGFVVYVIGGSNATPAVNSSSTFRVAQTIRSFNYASPYGQPWSFAVAAYRRSSSGVEIGPAITSAASPNWQGIGGASQVVTGGIADGNVTTVKIPDSNVTTPKIADNNVTTPKVADNNITTIKRQAVNSQSANTASLPVNTGTNPVNVYHGQVIFSISNSGMFPTSVAASGALGMVTCIVGNGATQIITGTTNLTTTTGLTTVAVNYW